MTTAKPATIAAVLLTCSLAACGGGGSTSRPASFTSSSSTTTTSPTSTGPSAASDSTQPLSKATQPLSKAELAWLDTYDRTVRNVTDQLGQGPETVDTTAAMLKEADRYRSCSRNLAKLPEPSARVRPAYDILSGACQHLDRAATCTQTLVKYMDKILVPGSDTDRKINEATDCVTAEATQAGTILVHAQTKSLDIRAAAGNLAALEPSPSTP